MTKEEQIGLAKSIALEHDLKPEIVCAIVEQESGWNPWAIRYEPNFYEWLISRVDAGKAVLKTFGPCNKETESRARSTSWGLMQVMGQVAREQGFDDPFLSSLCDPRAGLEAGCRKLAKEFLRAGRNLKKALLNYNGGGNKAYAQEVLQRAEKYL